LLKVVACIPAYNVEQTISSVVTGCFNFCDNVIVCDDGSIDNTYHEAKKSGAIVLQHKTNKGKGAALKSLFEYVKNMDIDIVVTIDGDGQFIPEEIPILKKPIEEEKADIVIGYRFDSSNQIPKYRKFGNIVLDKMTNLAAELPFKDTQSGFRTYSKKAIQQINFNSDGFAADSEILIKASEKDLKITERKVSVLYNKELDTSTKNPISHSSDIIGSLIELIAIRKPLRYIGIPGVVFLIIGIIYSVVVITIFNDTRYFSIPSTLVALGSLIIGLVLLLLSIVLYAITKNKSS